MLSARFTVTIQSNSGSKRSVIAGVFVLPNKIRQRNGLNMLGFFWGASALCLLLPERFWAMPLLLFVAGPIAFSRKYHQARMVREMTFFCPECGKEIHLAAHPLGTLKSFSCGDCRQHLTLQWPEEAIFFEPRFI